MIRYFLHIGYKGINYHGWQRQKGVPTIQESFENCLHQIYKFKIPCLGCGRTDAGVHAAQYFFHIDLKQELNLDLKFKLNKMLPNDIAIFDVLKIEQNYHAQFDATERTYDYFMHRVKDPFLAETSALYFIEKLDLDRMKQAALLLLKYSDFRALCKTPDKHNNTICNIQSVKLFTDSKREKIWFQISSNKFLRNMIRIIVYKLFEIGLGKLSLEEFENNIKTGTASKFMNLAYPQGLYLSKVSYPFMDIEPRTDMFGLLQNNNNDFWEEV